MGLKIDAKDFLANMSAIKQRSMFAAEKVGQNAAARMEGEAKRNARWTDRTGLARQTITGYSGWQGKKLRMGISGNMEYSVYLELGQKAGSRSSGRPCRRTSRKSWTTCGRWSDRWTHASGQWNT